MGGRPPTLACAHARPEAPAAAEAHLPSRGLVPTHLRCAAQVKRGGRFWERWGGIPLAPAMARRAPGELRHSPAMSTTARVCRPAASRRSRRSGSGAPASPIRLPQPFSPAPRRTYRPPISSSWRAICGLLRPALACGLSLLVGSSRGFLPPQRADLACTRYCYYQYYMVHSIQKGGQGGVVYCLIVVQ